MPVGRPPRGRRPRASAAARRALALRDTRARSSSGRTTACCCLRAERNGGIAAAHELANPEYALPSVSRTFHGRDLFAPAAAHLALGVELAELGPPIDPDALVRLDVPQPEFGTSRIRATVLYVDRVRERPAQPHARAPRAASASSRGRRSSSSSGTSATTPSRRGRSPTPAPGDIILYEDAYRNVVDRDQPRQRGSDVRRRARPGAADPRRLAVKPRPALRARRDGRRRPPSGALAAASPAAQIGSSTRLAPRGTASLGDAPGRLRGRRSRRPRRRRDARSTSAPARVTAPSRSRGAGRRPRSSASTSPSAMVAEARRKTPPELAGRVRFEQADASSASVRRRRRSTSSRSRT